MFVVQRVAVCNFLAAWAKSDWKITALCCRYDPLKVRGSGALGRGVPVSQQQAANQQQPCGIGAAWACGLQSRVQLLQHAWLDAAVLRLVI